MRNYDEARVRKFRARAGEIAQQFGITDEGLRADRMIGAALQTRKVTTGSASLAARQSGVPYDTAREPLFDNLHATLDHEGPMTIVAWDEDAPRRETLPFWEAYFSNFIEGTEFTVDEAIGIVYRNEIPRGRPADAHDILDTYRVVADDDEMSLRPSTFAEFEELLLRRHRWSWLVDPSPIPGSTKRYRTRPGRHCSCGQSW